MHPNAQVIKNFYESFKRLDVEGVVACYDPAAEFSDPAFPNLKGPLVTGMWRMLAARAKDFSLEYDSVEADDHKGSGHWMPTYTFSQTGRKVTNDIRSSFEFHNGKIIRHKDVFDLWKWAGMALGPKGTFLGWLPPVQNSIRKNARAGLEAFLAAGK